MQYGCDFASYKLCSVTIGIIRRKIEDKMEEKDSRQQMVNYCKSRVRGY